MHFVVQPSRAGSRGCFSSKDQGPFFRHAGAETQPSCRPRFEAAPYENAMKTTTSGVGWLRWPARGPSSLSIFWRVLHFLENCVQRGFRISSVGREASWLRSRAAGRLSLSGAPHLEVLCKMDPLRISLS